MQKKNFFFLVGSSLTFLSLQKSTFLLRRGVSLPTSFLIHVCFWRLKIIMLSSTVGFDLFLSFLNFPRYWWNGQKHQILTGHWSHSFAQHSREWRQHEPQKVWERGHLLQRFSMPRFASGRHFSILWRMCGIHRPRSQFLLWKSLCQLSLGKACGISHDFCASKASTSTIVTCKRVDANEVMNAAVLWFDYTWLSGIQSVCVWIPNPFFIYYTSTTEKFDMIAFVCSECVTAIYGPTVKEPYMWSIFRLNFSAHYFFFLMQKK